MTIATNGSHTAEVVDQVAELVVNPFLHLGRDRCYNPQTDRLVREGEPGYAALRRVLAGEIHGHRLPAPERELLLAGSWLLPADDDPSTRYHLKYVSLEAHTVCNQACYFCPVSFAPREDYFMPTQQYESIVRQLSAYRETVETVFLINYNEPTLDKRFLDQVRYLKENGLPPAVLTNGSGLTPARIDAIVAMGGLRYLSINLSTLDRERYSSDRGGDHLRAVMKNLDHAKDKPVGEQMEIIVLGTGDAAHKADVKAIRERFAGTRFQVKPHAVMDRAGLLQIGAKPPRPHQDLCGCENVGSRPLQHLHITPQAKVVLCCEDYDEHHIVGDLSESTVAEVLAGPQLALMRRWVYGIEEAPDEFMCRKCVFARSR